MKLVELVARSPRGDNQRLPVTWGEAFLLESMLQLVKTASFFIPGNLGAQEAGLALLCQWMGYEPSAGIALSLYKRFRQLVWTAAGFGVWGLYVIIKRYGKK